MERLLLLTLSRVVNKPKATINSIAGGLPKGSGSCAHCANNIVGCVCRDLRDCLKMQQREHCTIETASSGGAH